MNALNGFKYSHNNMVVVKTSIGNIELTYKVKSEVESEEANLLLAGVPSEVPAKNERTYFEAVLIDGLTNTIVCMDWGIVAEEAIANIYKKVAISRMVSENL